MTSADLEGFLGCPALLGTGGEALVPVASLVGKTVALYFSASWCPPCQRFTPHLAETYAALQAHAPRNVEFVFVSLDTDAAAFNAYRARMPWPALPFTVAQQRGKQLQAFFGAQGVPWLVTVNPDGTVANANAVRCAYADARGEHFPWEGRR
jgi:nucleoredoxin